MARKKNTSLDRVLGRLDTLDSVNLANLVQRLARERALFEDIFNTLQEGVLVIDGEGTIEYANAAAHRLIGTDAAQLDGQVLWRLVPGLQSSLDLSDRAGISNRRPQADALPEDRQPPLIAREFELTYPEPRSVRLYIVPFAGVARPGTRRFAVILSDITREKHSTEKRIEDERISSILLLAAGVAHELGNPLNSLTIHLQLMERQLARRKNTPESGTFAESLRICRDEVRRLDGIIANFLNAIRPRPPNLAETNLGEVLDEVLRFQHGELTDRGIAVEAEVSDSLPSVMADRDQIKQVFFNLTKNAAEAMQAGGALRVGFRTDDDSVFLLFGDTGSGISPAELARLFEPYHTTKAGGSGLGLMIVQRIMRDHGGRVGIESREGVGTLVTLEFPRKHRRVRMLPG